MIKSVLIKYNSGEEFRIGLSEGTTRAEVLQACWLKRHNTFKISTPDRTFYFPDRNIRVVEINDGPNEEETIREEDLV